jgi:hypothetical protein
MILVGDIRRENSGRTPKQSNSKNIIMFLKSSATNGSFINQYL